MIETPVKNVLLCRLYGKIKWSWREGLNATRNTNAHGKLLETNSGKLNEQGVLDVTYDLESKAVTLSWCRSGIPTITELTQSKEKLVEFMQNTSKNGSSAHKDLSSDLNNNPPDLVNLHSEPIILLNYNWHPEITPEGLPHKSEKSLRALFLEGVERADPVRAP